MRMLMWMCGVNRKNWKRNIIICEQLAITTIEDKMRKKQLK